MTNTDLFWLECISEQSKRPLYTITSGEATMEAEKTENKIREIFYIAERWKTVILTDEADVLMSKRSIESLGSNAIISSEPPGPPIAFLES